MSVDLAKPHTGRRRHQPHAVAQTQARQRKPEQLAGARPTLPPGATWALLTTGTCLDGLLYPESADGRT